MVSYLLKSPRLLIVDDEPASLIQMLDWLAPRQTKIYQARSGELALNILEKKTVDAVISDWQLPGLSGLELVSSLRASGFAGPLLICTGYMLDAQHLQQAFDAGANDYLRKPLNAVEFNARLDKSLSLYAKQYELTRFSESQNQLMALMTEQLGTELQRLTQIQDLELLDPETLIKFQPERHQLTHLLKTRFSRLMNWSRYRFTLNQLHSQPVEVRQLFKSLQQSYVQDQHRLQISAASGLELMSEPDLLQRVLSQLTENALRHTAGQVQLKAISHPQGVRLSVLDEGELTEGQLERILTGQEIGLGLRIIHDLLALLGSRLQGQLRRGQPGTQFFFDLPAR